MQDEVNHLSPGILTGPFKSSTWELQVPEQEHSVSAGKWKVRSRYCALLPQGAFTREAQKGPGSAIVFRMEYRAQDSVSCNAKETLMYCNPVKVRNGKQVSFTSSQFNVRQLFLISVAPKNVPLGSLEGDAYVFVTFLIKYETFIEIVISWKGKESYCLNVGEHIFSIIFNMTI